MFVSWLPPFHGKIYPFLVSCLSHLYHHSELGMISPILAGIVSLFFDGFCSKSLWHLWLQSSFHHPGFGTISIAPTSHFGGLNRRFLWVPSPILGEPLCIYTHTPLIYVYIYIYILYVCISYVYIYIYQNCLNPPIFVGSSSIKALHICAFWA